MKENGKNMKSLSRRGHAAFRTSIASSCRSWPTGLSVLCAAAAMAVVGCGSSSSFPEPAAQATVVSEMRKADSLGGGGAGGAGGGTGWGTLKGRFVFNGAPPALANIPTGGKDPLCKVPIKDESLVVDASTKGLKNVLVFLVEASRVNPDLASAPAKEAVFDQKECRFLDHVFAMQVKDKLAILNTDTTGHNTNGSPGRGNPSFNVLLAAVNGRFDYQFKNPLTVPFDATCSIHPWMKSYIIARPDPYFAVSRADGSFEIAKLPAGEELEFQVWHERGAGDGHGLKALPTWSNRGRFKVTIAKDGETIDLKEVAVEPSALQ
jgi:hypothetical protein